MTLKEKLITVLEAVKDDNLNKTQLEDYHTELSHLESDLRRFKATLIKEKALFLANNPDGLSDSRIKIKWNATESGQKLIDVTEFIRSANTELNGLKTRIYAKL